MVCSMKLEKMKERSGKLGVEKSEEWQRVDNRGEERKNLEEKEEDAVRSQGQPQGQLSE